MQDIRDSWRSVPGLPRWAQAATYIRQEPVHAPRIEQALSLMVRKAGLPQHRLFLRGKEQMVRDQVRYRRHSRTMRLGSGLRRLFGPPSGLREHQFHGAYRSKCEKRLGGILRQASVRDLLE